MARRSRVDWYQVKQFGTKPALVLNRSLDCGVIQLAKHSFYNLLDFDKVSWRVAVLTAFYENRGNEHVLNEKEIAIGDYSDTSIQTK